MADDANKALERLRGKLGPKRAELWLKGATVRIDGGHTVVLASSPFQKSGLETHCVELIDSLFGDAWSVETVERPSVPALIYDGHAFVPATPAIERKANPATVAGRRFRRGSAAGSRVSVDCIRRLAGLQMGQSTSH